MKNCKTQDNVFHVKHFNLDIVILSVKHTKKVFISIRETLILQ